MYKLPDRYKRNLVISNDQSVVGEYWEVTAKDLYQLPAYRWISKRIAGSVKPIETIIDLGCGNGIKTIDFFSKFDTRIIGIDQGSGIKQAKKNDKKSSIEWVASDLENDKTWKSTILSSKPGTLVNLDVIEHLEHPDEFLAALREATHGWEIIISTPNRDLLGYHDSMGPPRNERHVQEWNRTEFKSLLEEHGFTIIMQLDFLPRDYQLLSLREIKRISGRIWKFKKIPDAKSNQVWVLA